MRFCNFVLQKKLSEIAVLAALTIPFVSAFNQVTYTKSSTACREPSFENRFDGILRISSVATAFEQQKSKLFFALPNDSEEVDATLIEAQSAIKAAEEALQAGSALKSTEEPVDATSSVRVDDTAWGSQTKITKEVAEDVAASVTKQAISKQTQDDAIAAAAAGASKAIFGFFKGAITGAATSVVNRIKSVPAQVRDTIRSKIESAVDDVKRVPERLKESASKAATDVKEAATKKVEATTARIKEAPKLVVETTKAAATKAATEAKVAVDKTVEETKVRVKEAPKLVVEGAKAAAARATTEVKDVITKKVEEAKDAVVGAVDVVASFPGKKIEEVERLISGQPSEPQIMLNPEPPKVPPPPESRSAMEPKSSIELPKLSLPKIQLPEYTIPPVPERKSIEKTLSKKSPEATVAISKAPLPAQEQKEPDFIFNELSLQKLIGDRDERTEMKPTQSVLDFFQKAAESRRLELQEKQALESKKKDNSLRTANVQQTIEESDRQRQAEGLKQKEAEARAKAMLKFQQEREESLERQRQELAKKREEIAERQRQEKARKKAAAKEQAEAALKAKKEREEAKERQREEESKKKEEQARARAAEAKARAEAAAKAQKEQEDTRNRQRAQDAKRKEVEAMARAKAAQQSKQENAVQQAKPGATIRLFNFFGSGDEEVATVNPPKGVPVLSKWRKNSDGSISGIISGSPAYVDGDAISTSPIKGEAISGAVVTTQSGSRYFLKEKAGFSLFGLPSPGSKSSTNDKDAKITEERNLQRIAQEKAAKAEAARLALEKRQMDTDAERRAKAEAARLELQVKTDRIKKANTDAALMANEEKKRKLAEASKKVKISSFMKAQPPKGVPVIKSWRKNKNGSITGKIFGSPNFSDGDDVETSPITTGSIENGSVVTTGSGSRYYLSSGSGDLLKKSAQQVLRSAESGATISLFKSGDVLKKSAQQVLQAAKSGATISLFESGIEVTKSANPTPGTLKKSIIAAAPPRGVPSLEKWSKNRDGSITGIISGSPSFKDGDRITTSPIVSGEIKLGAIIQTVSGSLYFLR